MKLNTVVALEVGLCAMRCLCAIAWLPLAVTGGATSYEYRKSARLQLVFVAHNGGASNDHISIIYREVSNNRCSDANDGCYQSKLTPCPVSVCRWRKDRFGGDEWDDIPVNSVRDLALCTDKPPFALWWTQSASVYPAGGDGDGRVYYQKFTMYWSPSAQFWKFKTEGVRNQAYPAPPANGYIDNRGNHKPWGLACYGGFAHSETEDSAYTVFFNDRVTGTTHAIVGNVTTSVYNPGGVETRPSALDWQQPDVALSTVAEVDKPNWYKTNPASDVFGFGSNTGVHGDEGVFWTKTENYSPTASYHNLDAIPTSTADPYGPTCVIERSSCARVHSLALALRHDPRSAAPQRRGRRLERPRPPLRALSPAAHSRTLPLSLCLLRSSCPCADTRSPSSGEQVRFNLVGTNGRRRRARSDGRRVAHREPARAHLPQRRHRVVLERSGGGHLRRRPRQRRERRDRLGRAVVLDVRRERRPADVRCAGAHRDQQRHDHAERHWCPHLLRGVRRVKVGHRSECAADSLLHRH